ncbi:CNH-domain-containing protein [Pluteus cervinus]|uniref:CNH-domain-containing protein n=1 Tax=Pluteus cervinus TaxID=181527 RepID=A0ACD3BAF4_9AGAR|nr:CNH-domain-containing protein [Pluteus cervinus]
MERPMGPRQPPDKRQTAYDSIFGRPGSSQYPAGGPMPGYPHLQQPLQPTQPYQYQPQQYAANMDRRASYNSLYTAPGYAQQPQAPGYSQAYYPQQHPQQHIPQNAFPQNAPGTYNLPGQPLNGQNPALARTRSMASNPQTSGGFRPPLDEPPDRMANGFQPPDFSSFQPHSASGQLNGSNGPQTDWNRHRNPPSAADRHSYPQNGPSARPLDPPRLGVTLEHEDGRLGIDLTGNGSGNSSDQGTDEDSSELPWARKDPTTSSRRKSHPSPATNGQFAVSQSIRADIMGSQSPNLTTSPPPLPSVDGSSTAADPSRKSIDSSRITSRYGSTGRRDRVQQDRSMSLPVGSVPPRPISEPKGSPRLNAGRDSPARRHHHSRKTPIVYPALLSRVAEAFRDRITLTDKHKDGLIYKDGFDGREAVDKIAYIIKTTDRNLALLLGRALDAQKFFHDVTYDHRLRDNAGEVYQFRTKLPSPFVSGDLQNGDTVRNGKEMHVPSTIGHDSSAEENTAGPTFTRPRKGSISSDDVPLPSGVFTLLTDCYSPTCSRDRLCYSIACPRRLEQQARLNMRPQPGLSSKLSRESLIDVPEDGTLWIHSVPAEIVNSVSDREKKRQEAINEVIYTERDFVRDMEYLRDVWIKRLREDDCIPAERREDFIAQVFWNVNDIIAVSTRLRDAFNKRQKSYAVVERIGDILLDVVSQFGPFVVYGAHQLYGKFEFEKEKNSNPEFAQFVEHTERLPESRKLELNAYLTKPTTRLARYPLLLGAVLKHTPDDSPDKTMLPQAIALIRDFLDKVNSESGRTENRFNLIQLEQQLTFKPGEEIELRLTEEGREMVHKGLLNKRDGEVQVYLFDHALLFTKAVKAKQIDQYRVYRRPIPLELLSITVSEDIPSNRLRHRNTLVGRSSPAAAVRTEAKGQYWINFVHLGRKHYSLLLWANSAIAQKKWVDHIEKQQQQMRDRSMVFDVHVLSDGFFAGPNKVNCAAPFQGGRKVVYGTNDGIYLSDLQEAKGEPVKVLSLLDVAQVDVLEDYQLLIVLSERQVHTFPLDALNQNDPMAGLKRAKTISSHTSFFKAGYCLGRTLVCIVKSSQLSSTFKTLEPIDEHTRSRAKPTFRKLLQGGNDTLKLFREFYIPVESTSIHYLKTKMCVGCSRGFEIVDLETLDTQGLLDPVDESLEFVRRRENLRPMSIYRVGNEFLLCYDEFAFYVNKSGKRARKDFIIYWEGNPTGFALHEPYVLAFEQNFVEIRHIDTGLMSQVIQGSNIRLLFADTPPSNTGNNGPMQQQPYGQLGPGAHLYPGTGYGRGQRYNNGELNPYYQSQSPHTPTSPRSPHTLGRDEIIMVSDDRVFALRVAAAGGRVFSDAASVASSTR